MERDPEYVQTLMALPEARRKAMLYGDWNAFEGAFFPEFDPELHTCMDFEIPKEWIRFRGLDYGLDMTACLWFAVSSDGTVYVYRELYEKDLILSQAGKYILEHSPEEDAIRYTAASPDLWNRRQDSGKSGFDLLHTAGVKRLIKANNARIPGWRVIREYLRRREDGTARLVIFRSCKNLIRTLPLLRFDPDVIEDAADTPHEITHAPEALRYGLMSRMPKPASKPVPFRSRLYSFDAPATEEGYGQFIAY
jgi:phage terminase large subunit